MNTGFAGLLIVIALAGVVVAIVRSAGRGQSRRTDSSDGGYASDGGWTHRHNDPAPDTGKPQGHHHYHNHHSRDADGNSHHGHDGGSADGGGDGGGGGD